MNLSLLALRSLSTTFSKCNIATFKKNVYLTDSMMYAQVLACILG